MFKKMVSVLQGAVSWQILRLRFCVNEKTVILVLIRDNPKLDKYALIHLKDFMDRKYAKNAIIIFHNKATYKQICSITLPSSVRFCRWSELRIKQLYGYYSFYLFSDKIVFTYMDSPKDNLLGKLLRETSVQEEEAVCLGLYHLRTVPYIEKT